MAYASVATDDIQSALQHSTDGRERGKGLYEGVISQETSYSKVPGHSEHSVSVSTHSQQPPRPPWIPYTLRWPFLAFMVVVSLGLCAITAALTGYSKQNQGLGNNDGSSALLFGWRFTPTIVAVIYARLIGMVFNDFRRTEPFARMAKNPTSATYSVLQVPSAWWKMLAQAFSRKKNGGAVNWALANATIAFVLSGLVISSISSSFLTTTEITMHETVPLQKRTLRPNTPLLFQASPDVFLRTTGSLIYNLSIDPWTVGAYTVLPFWPEGSDLDTMLISGGRNQTQSWEATTSVFRTEYSCNMMNATITLNNTRSFSTYATKQPTMDVHPRQTLVNGTSKMDTTTLLSEDGCEYHIDMSPTLLANLVNNAVWGRAEDTLYDVGVQFVPDQYAQNTTDSWIYVPGLYEYSFDDESDPNSPLLRHNRSAACSGKDIIQMSTPLVDGSTNSFLGNFSQTAWECQLKISTADLPATYTLSTNGSKVTFDQDKFANEQTLVGNEIFNGSDIRRLLHQSMWLSYLDPATFKTDRSALLLSAEYQYDFDIMFSSKDVPQKAESTMQSFFAALLQSSVTIPDASETQNILGASTLTTSRVEVFQGTEIALSVLYGVCALLIAALAWQCTPNQRSLNLTSNPSTTEGVTDLVATGDWDRASWAPLFIASRDETEKFLRGKTYATAPKLQEHVQSPSLANDDSKHTLDTNKSVHDWKPTTLRIPSLISLIVYLISLAVGISILYDFATGNRLYSHILVNQVEFGEISGHVARLTPFSIIPSFMAVILGMWWDGISQKFCQLQPFIAITRPEGTQWKDGPGMHYSTTNWIKSSVRAGQNGHWLLMFVIVGNILSQIFIITASALFTRQTGIVSTTTSINSSLELRSLPLITESNDSFRTASTTYYQGDDDVDVDDVSSVAELERVLEVGSYYDLYWTEDSSWLYSATNEIVQGGNEPAWSMDGWSFTPVQMPLKPENETVSFITQGIRARVDCSPTSKGYDVSDDDTWLLTYDLTDERIWNTSANPHGLEKGYYIGNYTLYSTPFFIEGGRFPFCANSWDTVMSGAMWNDWGGDRPGRFPYRFSEWPFNFTATWIEGTARSNFLTRDNLTTTMSTETYDERIFPMTYCSTDSTTHVNVSMFTEVPKFQSVSCKPVAEIASAQTTVSQDGTVQSFELLEEPKPYDDLWKDVFVSYTHNTSDAGYTPSSDSLVDRNVTSSYGVYFLASLLRGPEVGDLRSSDTTGTSSFDNLYPYAVGGNSSAYFIRDTQRDSRRGTDLMSYCMYHLAGKNSTALLTNTTLFSDLVGKTFQTFFVHFVTGDANSTTRRAYQRMGDEMPDLGKKVVLDMDSKLLKQVDPESYPAPHTDTTVDGQMNRRTQMLKMNRAVTWLSFGILVSLLLITIAIAFLERRFLSPLHRNIECMADIMLLLAESNHLLSLVKERGVEALRCDDGLLVRLGWFRSKSGKTRWGIEVFDSGDGNFGGGKGMEVVWEEGDGSRTQSKWERVSTGLSNLSWGKKKS